MRTATSLVIAILVSSEVWADSLVYSHDFESPAGSEWSNQSTDVTPSGRGFLGQFGAESVSLTLTGLQEHAAVRLALELFIINTWDGNTGSSSGTADSWTVVVNGGPSLLLTTFSNNAENAPEHFQAFPDDFPGGSHPPRTGAAEGNTLGYALSGHGDALYSLEFLFSHSAPTLTVTFSATLTTGLGVSPLVDESWGVDNVHVYTRPAPEPTPLALVLIAGAVAMAIRRRAGRRWTPVGGN